MKFKTKLLLKYHKLIMTSTLSLIICLAAYSQDVPRIKSYEVTPGGLFDAVFDRFGKKHTLTNLQIPRNDFVQNKLPGTFSNNPTNITSFTTCGSGYFQIYFEPGCGMEGNSFTEVNRRTVICQVFSDISQFITSPLTSNGSKVNILIRDMANMGISTPSNNAILGLGSCFFCVPAIQNIGGIADNLIWQTITSGIDAYTNVANPLATPMIGGGNYYHGMLSINFSNPSVNWHYQLNNLPSATDVDLYTVALHEIAHSLGFLSLIEQSGQSRIGAAYPYYSRYDMNLSTQNNNRLITQTTTSCSNSRYSFHWNSNLSTAILQPGFTGTNSCNVDNTICNTAIVFSASVVQPVFTPNCYSFGSSLSHFEDQCNTASNGNNLYFVMANVISSGPLYMKRYFKPEERSALCDIGYACGNSFGNALTLNSFTYAGPSCPGAEVAGIHDGINTSGFYTYTCTINTPIALNGLLANDKFSSQNNNSFKCLEVIQGTGNLSVVSGIASSYTPTTPGLHLLRYIPLDGATNKEGNITYVYVYVKAGGCLPNTCDLINNGGFEDRFNCGAIDYINPCYLNCWNNVAGTSDLFVRGCTPVGTNSLSWSIPTNMCFPTSDTWNNGANNNDCFVGMVNANLSCEGLQTQLSSNLLPNTTYILSFQARIADNMGGNTYTSTTADLVFAASSVAIAPSIPFGGNITALMPGLTQLAHLQVPNNNKWNYYSVPISFTNNTTYSHLSIFNASWFSSTSNYVFIDDVSLKPALNTSTFNQPSPICQNQKIADLGSLVTAPNGTFTGTGVSYNTVTSFFEFNASTNLNAGQYLVGYSYSVTNCVNTIYQIIEVIGASLTTSSKWICAGSATTITPSASGNFTWSNGSTASVLIVTPTITTAYSLMANYSGSVCPLSTQTVLVYVMHPGTSISPASQTICPGQTATLIATISNTLGAFYLWDNNSTGSLVLVTPTVTKSYTVSGFDGWTGCSYPATTTVSVAEIFVTPSSTICLGESATLTASGALSYSWTNGTTSSISIVNPITAGSKNYSVKLSWPTNTCSISKSVLVSACLELNELPANFNVRVFPNPTCGKIELETEVEIELRVYNVLGQTLIDYSLSKGNHHLDLSALSNGVYCMIVSNKNIRKSFSIVRSQ